MKLKLMAIATLVVAALVVYVNAPGVSA